MRVVVGKQILEVTAAELARRREGCASILIDVGTGDGKFVYRQAQEHPDMLCIGIDPAAERMRETSWRAARKPARGGVGNALFVVAEVERPPVELHGLADQLTVNYPWGRLLEVLVVPDVAGLAGLARLGKPGASILLLLNYSVFEDAAYLERLGLPGLDEARVDEVLVPAWRAAGIDLVARERVETAPAQRSSWGQRLTLGSARKTFRIEGRVRETATG